MLVCPDLDITHRRLRDFQNSLCPGFLEWMIIVGFEALEAWRWCLNIAPTETTKITLCVIMCNDVNDTKQWQTFGRAADAQ